MERRVLASEVRASAAGNKMKVSGYAARYGVLSQQIQPGVKERIQKRAFDKVLRSKPDVVATFNHNNDVILGRTTSGTLQLRSDDNGLAFDCDLPNTTAARDLYESVRRGDINGCSFAFKLGEGDDEFSEEEDDEVRGSKVIVRNINNFSQLFDVALVTSPCYPGTSVDARNLVSAELRSRLRAFKTPTNPTISRRRRFQLEHGITNTRSYEQARDEEASIVARRKQLTSFLLS